MPENLKNLQLKELRQMWTKTWGIRSNTRIGRTMMEKSLQYKIFKKSGQGLGPQEKDKLNQLIKAYKRNPKKPELLNTNLKDGTRLVRTWKGEKHIVTVSGTKFQYRGLTYGSLSKIANDITGKSWNGWVFFGLKKKKKKKAMKPKVKSCAIYTRTSSDESLNMDFNSLDAQRESCEAYITSQKAEGWKMIKTSYSDGGYSGGNTERPGLQKLLADIKEGKIQTVVVYKIDRLTRSLMDFSKLVEIFDAHGVTFVSVTQSFNTTTSMGRLTLNVLLSFAQFEREVSAERIRDKIAASKKKGMWMGGMPPIGYEAQDKKLIINEEEAKIVRYIFDTYLSLGCVAKMKTELDDKNIISRTRTSKRGRTVGGKPYSHGALYSFLKNPIYAGKIKHKDKIYDGLHEAIISEDIWNAVQQKLKDQTKTTLGRKNSRETNLLKGLLFDSEDTPYSPDYTKKKNSQIYRYYTSQNLIQYRDHPSGIMARIPAQEIEKTVTKAIQQNIINIIDLDSIKDHTIIEYLETHKIPPDDLVKNGVNKIGVQQNRLEIDVKITCLRQYLQEYLKLHIPIKTKKQRHTLSVPFTIRRAHKGTIIIKAETAENDRLDLPPVQLKNLVRGIVWRDKHFAGTTLREIAYQENMSEAGVRKIIMGSFDTLMSL